MTEALKLPSYEKLTSLDRDDIFESSLQVYPDSYKEFQKSIENIYFKSELLLKCKLEFDRLVTIDFPDSLQCSNSCQKDMNLSLIFTGAIKSGRSSLINMLLNAKVMPTNIIGSSCCVSITHPNNKGKQISVGVHDIDGWEIDRYSNLDVSELPKKIENLQHSLARKLCEKNDESVRRIHVQLPHWLLKNINVYECPAIDGIHSFEEPFNIILNVVHPILVHVIDASNGLMQWDKTFLAKILHKWPHLPTFFIINHVDIPQDILQRDHGPRFESISDKFRFEQLESESSDHNSTDDNTSENNYSGETYNENTRLAHQENLIERCKKQLSKLGFMLANNTSIRYAALSVKEFLLMLRSREKQINNYWKLVEEFFVKFNNYLIMWLEKLLITSSLEHKSRVNGVIDAMRYCALFPHDTQPDAYSDFHLQEIKKADANIKEEFRRVENQLEKDVAQLTKNQLKKHQHFIRSVLPDLSGDDSHDIIQNIKPKLLASFETVLLVATDGFDFNEEIYNNLEKVFVRLKEFFSKFCHANQTLSFMKYIRYIFRAFRLTLVYPLVIHLPEDFLYTESKWYKELLKIAARKILGPNSNHQNVLVELINDINVSSVIKVIQHALSNISKQIQLFIQRYQETYRLSFLNSMSPEVFKKLLLEDFIIRVIEHSFQKQTISLKIEDLLKLPTFFNEFFDQKDSMIKCINLQSFTSLYDVINILCFKRICSPNPYIMTHRSTKLFNDGVCVLYYTKMDYDLLNAVQNNMIWHVNDVIGIIKQLLNAIKYLQIFQKFLHIDLLPENIMLRKDRRGLHECVFYPLTAEISSIGYNYRSKKKFTSRLYGVIFQIGMVLSWLLTNDIFVCKMITGDSNCKLEEFQADICPKVSDVFKQSGLLKLAMDLLFHNADFSNIETIIKELDIMKDNLHV